MLSTQTAPLPPFPSPLPAGCCPTHSPSGGDAPLDQLLSPPEVVALELVLGAVLTRYGVYMQGKGGKGRGGEVWALGAFDVTDTTI